VYEEFIFWGKWLLEGPKEDQALARLIATVPRPRGLLNDRDLKKFFPLVFNDPEVPTYTPVNGIVLDRIRPTSEEYRVHIIKRLVAPDLQASAISDPANQYCLLDLWLGALDAGNPTNQTVGQRSLGLNQIRAEIGDNGAINAAETMAIALAILHWGLNLDGYGVRFLVGCQLSPDHRPVYLSHVNGFKTFVPTVENVREILVPLYIGNRAWPRPAIGGFEGEMWRAFRRLYIDFSLYIIYRERRTMTVKDYAARWWLAGFFIRCIDRNMIPEPRLDNKHLPLPHKPYRRSAYDQYREFGPKPQIGPAQETEGEPSYKPTSKDGPPRKWGSRWRCGPGGQGDVPKSIDFVLPDPGEAQQREEDAGKSGNGKRLQIEGVNADKNENDKGKEENGKEENGKEEGGKENHDQENGKQENHDQENGRQENDKAKNTEI